MTGKPETGNIPPEALNRGVRALRALPWPHWEIAPEQVVRVVLLAAIPALAEAVQAEYYGWLDLDSRSSTQLTTVTSPGQALLAAKDGGRQ